jgi:transposase InsO family protein
VLVIQTDNGAEFQSNFHWHLEERDIRHVYIRPRTPRLNGKVERSPCGRAGVLPNAR